MSGIGDLRKFENSEFSKISEVFYVATFSRTVSIFTLTLLQYLDAHVTSRDLLFIKNYYDPNFYTVFGLARQLSIKNQKKKSQKFWVKKLFDQIFDSSEKVVSKNEIWVPTSSNLTFIFQPLAPLICFRVKNWIFDQIFEMKE